MSEIDPVPNTVPDSIIEENVVLPEAESSENRIILSPQPGPSGLQQKQIQGKNSEISRDFPLLVQLDLSSDESEEDEDIQVVKISRKNSPNSTKKSKKRSIEEVDLTSENDVVSVTFDKRVLSNSIFTRDISRENSNDAQPKVSLRKKKSHFRRIKTHFFTFSKVPKHTF